MSSYKLRLYISGSRGIGKKAERNVREQLARRAVPCELEVVDLLQDPQAAERYRVMAVPSLDRIAPTPVRRIVGFARDYGDALDLLGIGDE